MKQPFIVIAALFTVAIILQKLTIIALEWVWAAALVFILGVGILRKTKLLVTLFIYLLMISSMMLWTESSQRRPASDISKLSYYQRQAITSLKGVVISDVERRPYFKTTKTVFTLKVKEVIIDGESYERKGKVLLNIFRPVDVVYGDEVEVEGKLHPPFEDKKKGAVSYSDYLRIQGIDYIFSVKRSAAFKVLEHDKGFWGQSISLKLRNKLKKVFDSYLSENESGIMKAVILGERTHIPDHVKEIFLRTGTTHILAISGLNMGVVAFLLIAFLKLFPLPHRLIYFLAITILVAYTMLTGCRPSVVRATIMIVVLLMGHVLEKWGDSFNNLAFAAVIILFFNPLNLFDIGFQLSFACVAAILFVYRYLKNYQVEFGIWRSVKDSIIISFVVWIATAGLIAYYFQVITPVGILANLFVIPASDLVVFLGFLLLLIHYCLPFFAGAVAMTLKLSLNILVGGTFLFNQLPWSFYTVSSVTCWYLVSYYILIMFTVIFFCLIDKRRQL